MARGRDSRRAYKWDWLRRLPKTIISMMFLRLARADESGIAEPSRMRHVCENLHRAGLTGINRNDSVGPGPTLLEQCPPQRAQPCPVSVPLSGASAEVLSPVGRH